MPSLLDEFHQIHSFQLRTYDELAQAPTGLAQPLMTGLINAGELTVFRADAGVDTTEFMYLLARCLATDSPLGPFEAAGAVQVALLVGAGHSAADAAFLHLLQQHDQEWTQADTRRRLAVYHRHREKDGAVHLDTVGGRNALLQTLAHRPQTQVVILDDAARWFSAKGRSDDELPLEMVLRDLAKRGIALVVFDKASKVGERLCNQYLAHASNLVRLTPDACAPTEIGSGFNIVRQKVGLHDKLPSTIQWWWAVIDGEFKTGWEWRDPASELTPKQVAMAERQVLVRKYAAQGLSQKEIARALKIAQWTVSRDLSRPVRLVKPEAAMRKELPDAKEGVGGELS